MTNEQFSQPINRKYLDNQFFKFIYSKFWCLLLNLNFLKFLDLLVIITEESTAYFWPLHFWSDQIFCHQHILVAVRLFMFQSRKIICCKITEIFVVNRENVQLDSFCVVCYIHPPATVFKPLKYEVIQLVCSYSFY